MTLLLPFTASTVYLRVRKLCSNNFCRATELTDSAPDDQLLVGALAVVDNMSWHLVKDELA